MKKRYVATVEVSLLSSKQPNSCIFRKGNSIRLLSEQHVWTRNFSLQAKIFATDHISPFHVQVTVQHDKTL